MSMFLELENKHFALYCRLVFFITLQKKIVAIASVEKVKFKVVPAATFPILISVTFFNLINT